MRFRLVLASTLAVLAAWATAPSASAQQRIRFFCGASAENCGRAGQPICDSAPTCDAGFARYDCGGYADCPFPIPDEPIVGFCYKCGGPGEIGCMGGCNTGVAKATVGSLYNDPTDGISPLQACVDTIPNTSVGTSECPVTQHELITNRGLCSAGTPQNFTSGVSREPWPAVDPPSSERGTIVFIHGGGSCDNRSGMFVPGNADLDARNHLVYCAEHAIVQPDPPGAPPRPSFSTSVRILPLIKDETGVAQCDANTCEFDLNRPIWEGNAPSRTMREIAAVVVEGLKTVPAAGELTLLVHSRGGYLTREILHRHYDELRWAGRKVSRVITLAHPYFGREHDPQTYAAWGCASADRNDDLGCESLRWLRGYDDYRASASGPVYPIDDSDFPQIEWTATGAAGIAPGGSSPAPLTKECSYAMGGIYNDTVLGDTSVPTLSSLGVDEFDHYRAVTALDFDRALTVPSSCGHNAPCHLRQAFALAPDLVPTAAEPTLPPGSLDFDGVNDGVVVATPAAIAGLTLTSNFTLEVSFRLEAIDGGMLLNKEGEYEIGIQPGTGELFWALANSDPGWNAVLTGYQVPLHQWTHVSVVHDAAANAARTYVNGALVHTRAVSGAVGDVHAVDDVRVGNRGTNDSPFHGRIDDVRIWKRVRSHAEIRADLVDGPAFNAAGLAAHWRFEEPAGSLAIDSSLSSFDLLLNGLGASAVPIHRPDDREQLGGALYFDGFDDFVGVTEVSAMNPLRATDALTLEAWVYPRGNGNTTFGSVIINKEGEYQLYRNPSGNLVFTLAGTPFQWSSRTTSVQLPLRQWSHVALRYDAQLTHVEIYRDGALAESIACHPSSPATPCGGPIGDFHTNWNALRIGGRENPNNAHHFHGAIDEVRVWNVARDPTEIAANYARPVAPGAVGLVGYWRFDEARSGVALDASTMGNHAVLGEGVVSQEPGPAVSRQLPGYPAALALDRDEDGIAAVIDNCPHAYNPGQEDNGGVGSAAAPDGIGDACQCGDVTGDGRVTNADAIVLVRSRLVPPTATPAHPERCDVGGSSGCTGADAIILTRALLVPSTATVQQRCEPALP